ncbi:MAG: ribosome-binding factor A [Candidatus Paceibacterota bacterium]
MSERQEKVSEEIAHLAAQFLARESNRRSLITVTRSEISPDLKQATIYFTVLPEEKEKDALHFLMRKRSDVRKHIKEHTKLKALPYIDFAIDQGEKNRQHIDTLLQES